MSASDLPAVSVVLPVHNAEETLEECLASLLRLDYPPDRHEIIAVDNGSRDASAEILRRAAGRVRVMHEPKRGPSAARNRGIREAQYPVIALTDSDCRVDAQWLRELVSPLSQASTGICGGPIRSWSQTNRVELFGEVIHDAYKAITQYRPPYVATGNWAARKDVIQQVGGFDESFLRAEDVELSCRVLQAGFRLAYAERAVVYHRNESTYRGLFREGFAHGLHNIALVERHRAFFQSSGYRPRRLKHYLQLLRMLAAYCGRKDPRTGPCALVFNSGKRLGRLAGSARHGSLHL